VVCAFDARTRRDLEFDGQFGLLVLAFPLFLLLLSLLLLLYLFLFLFLFLLFLLCHVGCVRDK